MRRHPAIAEVAVCGIPPQAVVIKPAFPHNAAGKTTKRDMREPYWAGRTSRIQAAGWNTELPMPARATASNNVSAKR